MFNWNIQYYSTFYNFPCKFFILDSMHVWFIGYSYEFTGPKNIYIHRTTDGGNNWQLIHSMYSLPVSDIAFTDSLHGWMVCEYMAPDSITGYQVIHTHDGGITWTGQLDVTAIPGLENDKVRSVYFTDSLHGWIAGGLTPYTIDTSGFISRTTDGGHSWQKQIADTIPSLNCVRFIDGNTGWAVGEHGTILHTIDGGLHWSYQVSNTKQGLNYLHFTGNNHGWVCGDSSTVLHTNNGGVTGIDHWHKDNGGFRVFPNPVSDVATIELKLKQPQNITFRLIDMTGRVKMTIPYGEKQNGPLRLILNVDNQPAGMYFIEVITENGVMTKNIIIN